MAYYSYSYDGDNQGGYYNGGYSITPYNSSYDSSSDHDSVAYSSYNYNQHQGFSYDPPSYYAAYDPVSSYSRTAYSESTFSEPMCIKYDPVSSYSRTAYSESTFSEPMCIKYDPGHYYHEQTRFIVSYDVSEFNETDFEEYDPTPYDGGFDLAAIYGKPLPPSAETCYPRSTPDPNVASLDGFSYGSIIAPYGKDEVSEPAAKPQSESKPIRPPPIEAAPVPLEFSDGHGNSQEKVQRDEESEGKGAYHPDPWPGYDTGIARDWPQVPSGYGLEAMDLCEGLFGYWPCLSRYARNNHDCQKAADCGSSDPCCGRWDDGGSGYGHQWKVTTADYLFGSSNPYGDRRDDGGGNSFGNVTYGYERHYQEEPLFYQQHYQEEPLYYQQVKYVEDPWRS